MTVIVDDLRRQRADDLLQPRCPPARPRPLVKTIEASGRSVEDEAGGDRRHCSGKWGTFALAGQLARAYLVAFVAPPRVPFSLGPPSVQTRPLPG